MSNKDKLDIDLAIDEIEAVAEKSMNSVQRRVWRTTLRQYSQAVIIAGWNDFLGAITPGYLPKPEKAKQVFSDVQIHNAFDSTPHDPKESEELKRYGRQQIGDILKYLQENSKEQFTPPEAPEAEKPPKEPEVEQEETAVETETASELPY